MDKINVFCKSAHGPHFTKDPIDILPNPTDPSIFHLSNINGFYQTRNSYSKHSCYEILEGGNAKVQ